MRQRALERQRQRVARGEREERDLDRVRALEVRRRCRARRCSRACGRCSSCATPRAARPSTSRCRSAAGCRRSCWRARGARTSPGSRPPCTAKVKSTAYSGSTAISASTVSARPCDTSSWRVSAAQASRNAEPRMARPKTTGATTSPRPTPDDPGEHARERWPAPRATRASDLAPGAPERGRGALGGRRRHPPHPTGRRFRASGRSAGPPDPRCAKTANELSGTGEEQPKFTVLDEVHRPSPRGRSTRKHETDDQPLAPIRPLSGRRS